jgi:hypothetical protein
MTLRHLSACLLAGLLLTAGHGLEAKAARKASAGSSRFERHPWHKAVDAKKQEVSGNVGGLAWGLADVNYEAALGDKNSWLAGADLGYRGYSGWSYSAMGVHGSFRWWWLEDRPLQGIYAGPRAGLIIYNYSYDYYSGLNKSSESISATGISVGGEGGYQWIFNNGLLLRAGGELNYVIGSVSAKAGAPTLNGFGFWPNYVAAVGYAW